MPKEEARERERAKTTPLRNEAQLTCVALRSQLDCEVTYGAMLTSENKLRRAATSALTFMTFS
jgi:hypothetical protein